jgi:hypothetical protein
VFERYTEKARRVIFFARYEASQYGSPYIETEHLLLGLFREARQMQQLLPLGSGESIRKEVDAHRTGHKKTSTSVDLPLSNESKRVLAYGAEEAERLGHRHIGTEHLLLGLLREEGCFAAAMLRERGMSLEKLRDKFANAYPATWPSFDSSPDRPGRPHRFPGSTTVEIHGSAWNADYIHERVKACREFNWHWHKQDYKPRDLAIHRSDARISFELSLAGNPAEFQLAKNAWTKDHCLICRWEVMASSDPQHSTAYTNGRDWVCTECYEKFLQGPDFFATSHPEIT